jgi:hypothetical protein
MRVFGRSISKWWLVACPAGAHLGLSRVADAVFMGNNLAGAVFGPPAIWNRTWNSPPRSDLLGTYQESERHLDQATGTPPARITLEADGSMTVFALPSQSELSSCTLSRRGFWGGANDGKIDIRFPSSEDKSTCDTNSYWSLELAGHSKPYSLYMSVGDPDSGTGIWFRQK